MKIGLIGDVHANIPFCEAAVKTLRDLGAEYTIQLGDLGVGFAAYMMNDVGLDAALLGNHDFQDMDGFCPDEIWLDDYGFTDIRQLRRGERFTMGGRTFLALGGGESIDRAWRAPGKSWWPGESIRPEWLDAHVDPALPIDVVLAHTLPFGALRYGVAEFLPFFQDGPYVATEHALDTLVGQMERVGTLPSLWFGAHWHQPFSFSYRGVRYEILDRDGEGLDNVALLDTETLAVTRPFAKGGSG